MLRDNPTHAALLVLSAALLFVLMGGFIKYLERYLPLERVVFFLNLFGLLALLPRLLRNGVATLHTGKLYLSVGSDEVNGRTASR